MTDTEIVNWIEEKGECPVEIDNWHGKWATGPWTDCKRYESLREAIEDIAMREKLEKLAKESKHA